MPVYVPAFAGTHCAYPQRDGQAELTWVAGYILRPTELTRPGCRITSFDCNQFWLTASRPQITIYTNTFYKLTAIATNGLLSLGKANHALSPHACVFQSFVYLFKTLIVQLAVSVNCLDEHGYKQTFCITNCGQTTEDHDYY